MGVARISLCSERAGPSKSTLFVLALATYNVAQSAAFVAWGTLGMVASGIVCEGPGVGVLGGESYIWADLQSSLCHADLWPKGPSAAEVDKYNFWLLKDSKGYANSSLYRLSSSATPPQALDMRRALVPLGSMIPSTKISLPSRTDPPSVHCALLDSTSELYRADMPGRRSHRRCIPWSHSGRPRIASSSSNSSTQPPTSTATDDQHGVCPKRGPYQSPLSPCHRPPTYGILYPLFPSPFTPFYLREHTVGPLDDRALDFLRS